MSPAPDPIETLKAQLQASRKGHVLPERYRPRPDFSHLDDPGLWARIGMTDAVEGDGEVAEVVKVITAPTDPAQMLWLEEAARILRPDGSVSVAALRRELRSRGLLSRFANKDYCTPADIEELKRSCLVQAKVRVSPSTKPKGAPRSGRSATDSGPSALDALKANAQKLRQSLPSTSSRSTTPEQASAEVIPMRSR